jgi:carbon storage regulator
MLVLSRKVGEKILIGDQIAVTVVRVAHGIVRIGVEAPNDMPIVREEVKARMEAEASNPKAAAPQ